MGRDCECRAKRCRDARPRTNTPLRTSRRGEAHRRPGNGRRPPCGVGWRGSAVSGTPPQDYRRGHRPSTDTVHSPAPRVSAGLRFAVRPLSEAMDRERTKSGAWVGTSSTAERSPFPSRGRLKRGPSWGVTANVGHRCSLSTVHYPLHSPIKQKKTAAFTTVSDYSLTSDQQPASSATPPTHPCLRRISR